MRTLPQVLYDFNEQVDKYQNLTLKFVTDQADILRELNCLYKEMAEHRIREHERWMSFKFNSQAKSNAAKESEADTKVPELYQLRHIMTSCKMLIDSVRSTISIYKNEA